MDIGLPELQQPKESCSPTWKSCPDSQNGLTYWNKKTFKFYFSVDDIFLNYLDSLVLESLGPNCEVFCFLNVKIDGQ